MRKILVVGDMQNDFIDGALGTKEAVAIVPNVVEKIKEYDPWNVYLTRDTHYENYLDTQEGRNLPVPHCIKDTHGWEICDAVKAVTERAEAKKAKNFAEADRLRDELNAQGVEVIDIAGGAKWKRV